MGGGGGGGGLGITEKEKNKEKNDPKHQPRQAINSTENTCSLVGCSMTVSGFRLTDMKLSFVQHFSFTPKRQPVR